MESVVEIFFLYEIKKHGGWIDKLVPHRRAEQIILRKDCELTFDLTHAASALELRNKKFRILVILRVLYAWTLKWTQNCAVIDLKPPVYSKILARKNCEKNVVSAEFMKIRRAKIDPCEERCVEKRSFEMWVRAITKEVNFHFDIIYNENDEFSGRRKTRNWKRMK